MLQFYWNGIKENGGQLQKAFYLDGKYVNHPDGTITIHARDYRRFSSGVRAEFVVENGTDIMTDYFEEDRIRVEPTHRLYADVRSALEKQKAHQKRRSERWAEKVFAAKAVGV